MTTINDLTMGGRLRPSRWVNARKVQEVANLLGKARRGDFVAEAKLMEALTTTEAPFSLATLANIQFLPNYDEAPRKWKEIAGVRQVRDFRPAALHSISRSWSNDPGGDEPSGIVGGEPGDANYGAPTIPEGTPYPYAYISGEYAEGASVTKKGFKTDWTLEARINDGLSSLDRLPDEMLQVALDTEEDEVFGALVTQGKSKTLAGGLVPGNFTVPANAPLSWEALARAVIELSQRTIGGRKIGASTNGYNLIVPVGAKIFVDYILNKSLVEEQNGLLTFSVNDGAPLSAISVVESEYLSGNEWFMLPKVGGTRRPVLERLVLRGYETPELMVENLAGQYIGGGAVSPWEGDFDADVITLKLRQFGGGVLWDSGESVMYSTGAGA